ncbi:MAG: methyltransferase [Planctomycetota bacterium]
MSDQSGSPSSSSLDLSSGEGDWQITPHGRFLGRALEDFDLVRGKRVLELGAGLANHTIRAARRGASSIVATEIAPSLLDTAKKNFAKHCPDFGEIEYRVADWLAVDGVNDADLLLTNPPFAKSGQRNRRYFIDSLILDSHKRLAPEGELLFIQSSMADIEKTLRRLAENRWEAQVIAKEQNPFRDYYYDDAEFMAEAKRVSGGFEVKDGKEWETLYVVHAKLRPWTPPAFAHIVEDAL